MDGGRRQAQRPATRPGPVQLRLLDSFELLRGDVALPLQPQARQLLAFLALSARPVPRTLVASRLWMDTSEQRAQANLRSALWRLRHTGCPLLEEACGQLHLAADIQVDVRSTVDQARRLVAADQALKPGDERLAPLLAELLPGWWEEWVLVERERLRQLQLHALERLAERLLAAGRVAHALDAALSAVAAEPLRESAQRLVVAIHLSEGNRSEALRQYTTYCALLRQEVGFGPSPHMARLVAELSADDAAPVVGHGVGALATRAPSAARALP